MSFKAALGFFASLAITALLIAGLARAEPVKLVGFGDSLMAGYQLPAADAFPVKLEAALRRATRSRSPMPAFPATRPPAAFPASIGRSPRERRASSSNSAAPRCAARHRPGTDPEKNLDAMLTRLRERGIPVLLAGMLALPNMGADYAERFNGIYKRLSDKHGAALPVLPRGCRDQGEPGAVRILFVSY